MSLIHRAPPRRRSRAELAGRVLVLLLEVALLAAVAVIVALVFFQ